MSSYLEKEQAKFKARVQKAAGAISNKRTFNDSNSTPVPPSQIKSTPSPAANDDSSQKRKRDTQPVVFSQPSDTGFGTDTFTQVTYAIDYLKKKGDPKTFREILDYLSLNNQSEQAKINLAGILKKHGRIEWIPDSKKKNWDAGTYKHRPLIAVRTKDELLAYLQRRADFMGVAVKDLKDGWPDCEDAITELERQHKLLVTRTKKDSHARMVWADDPTLYHPVEEEFTTMWHRVELASPDDLVRKLMDAGQKPASEDPSKRVKAAPKEKTKKKRPPRKGGRTTNTHMEHLLRDFDHLRG